MPNGFNNLHAPTTAVSPTPKYPRKVEVTPTNSKSIASLAGIFSQVQTIIKWQTEVLNVV
jgi:hypothetical protein